MWDKFAHVSRWPSYDLPEKDKPYTLAVWNESRRCVIIYKTGEVIYFQDVDVFIHEITTRRCYVFGYRLIDKKFFSILEELLHDNGRHPPRAKAFCSRTGHVVGVYIKSKYSAWIIGREQWDDGLCPPDKAFLDTITEVYRVNNRYAATPGSLGERKIREYLPKGTRFNRPSQMLRRVLFTNKVGGRADTTVLKKQFKVLYEEDGNAFYPAMSMETINPGEHPTRFGDHIDCTDKDVLEQFFSYFAHAIVSIPLDSRVRFGSLPTHSRNDTVRYNTEPGTVLEGWWWKEELDQARSDGWLVEVYEGYGWYTSSDWLKAWALHMYQLRSETKGKIKEIIKKETVAALGRFGVAPETLTLVKEEDYQDGDLAVPITDARAWESPISGYYIHVTPNPNSNALTHIYFYILMKARCALRARMLAEELVGRQVIASNYDSYYLTQPTGLTQQVGSGIGEWKQRVIRKAYISAPRSIKGIRDGIPIDKRPGVRRQGRKMPT